MVDIVFITDIGINFSLAQVDHSRGNMLIKSRSAIARRYKAVEITAPLMRLGRPLTPLEKRARKEAGRDGPKGPGAA